MSLLEPRVHTATPIAVVDTASSPHAALRPVGLNQIQITGGFWAPVLRRNREVTVGAIYQRLLSSGTLDNFHRAAGAMDGGFQGKFFADSDVYKWLEAACWTLVGGPDPVLPLYIVLGKLHLQNTLIGLSLVLIMFQLPFATFMMRNSFDSMPRELEEAALVDGCTVLGALRRVVLRIVMPGLVTVALFAFLAAWNEFLAPLIFLTDNNKYTMPVMLVNAISGTFGTVDWGLLQAGIVLTMLPCIVLFLVLQRYYVSGLVSGAVRG
ncbi:MAG TPA: ABC transporter permease subunit [Actinomycetes bacterium]